MKIDLWNRKQQLQLRIDELEEKLTSKETELKAAQELLDEVTAERDELKKSANGVPQEEVDKLVEQNKELSDKISEVSTENEELKVKMTEFEKVTSDKAVDILAQCGAEPVVTEPTGNPVAIETNTVDKRFVYKKRV